MHEHYAFLSVCVRARARERVHVCACVRACGVRVCSKYFHYSHAEIVKSLCIIFFVFVVSSHRLVSHNMFLYLYSGIF